MRLRRRLAKKMLRAEAECSRLGLPMRHAAGRREQARVRMNPSWANRAYFEEPRDA